MTNKSTEERIAKETIRWLIENEAWNEYDCRSAIETVFPLERMEAEGIENDGLHWETMEDLVHHALLDMRIGRLRKIEDYNSIEGSGTPGWLAEDALRQMIVSGTAKLYEPLQALKIYFPPHVLATLKIDEDTLDWNLAAEFLGNAIADLKSGKRKMPGYHTHVRRFDIEIEEIRMAKVTVFATSADEAERNAQNSVEADDFEIDCRIPRSIVDYEVRRQAIKAARKMNMETAQ